MSPTPAPPSRRLELVVIVALLTAWLGGWLLLTVAAIVAGAHPTRSPIDAINPVVILRTYSADGNRLVWWHLVGAGAPSRPWLFTAVVVAVPVAVLAAAGLGAMAWSGGVPGFASARLLLPARVARDSRWASWHDLRRLRVRNPRPGGLVLGRRGPSLLATEPETSVLVIGPTRSGKTSSLLVPNLLRWPGPAIVTSTKAELVDLTAAARRRQGPVHVYDPTGDTRSPLRTSWSPLAGCHSLDDCWRVAAWLCAGLQSGESRDNDWAHWAESGKLLVAPLLYVAAGTGRSIVEVARWISRFSLSEPLELLATLAGDPLLAADAGRAADMLASVDQRPDKERGTVFSTVSRLFGVFNEQPVALSASRSDFDPAAFLRERGTLYLCTPAQTPERVASLFVGILMSVVTAAYARADTMPRGRLVPELGLFLDELANVVPVDDLPGLASQGAGRGVVLMSIVQDLSQLRSRYGADRAHSILNNHGCKVVLPGMSDPQTTELLSRLIGRTAYTDVQVSHQQQGVSRSYSVHRDHIASPDALRQLPRGTALVLYRGCPPTVVRLQPWHTDRRLVSLVGAA
ncbi:MAG: type IV secretory system conjugative DNA transfer family protein [Candidatus Dormibacteria bacterium]